MNELLYLIKRTSCAFKAGVICLFLAMILHMIGLSTNKWSIANSSWKHGSNTTWISGLWYLGGLWSHCACRKMLGYKACTCLNKDIEMAWFTATHVTVVMSLIGLVVSCALSFVAIFCSRRTIIRIINIIVTSCAGALMFVAVLIYGTEANNHIDESFLTLKPPLRKASFGYSYICCCISSVLCVIVVLPLFIIDLKLTTKATSSDVTSVQYTTQE